MDELMTKEYAMELDVKIKTYANAAWANLVESCKCLKQMRDTKGYEALGFLTFGEYTEASLNIKERQAYTYISTLENQGERFLQSNANLGITKLALLNAVPVTEREELIENNDLAGMSVSEVEALVKDNNGKAEQIELLEEEKQGLKGEVEEKSDKLIEAEERIKELEELYEQEKNKPVEVAVVEPSPEQIAKIKADAEAAVKKELKKVVSDYEGKITQAKKEAEKTAKEKADKELNAYKEKVAAADKAKTEAIKKAEELQKQLAVSSCAEATKFIFFFSSIQEDFKKITESLEKLKNENPELGRKYQDAFNKYIKMLSENIKQ